MLDDDDVFTAEESEIERIRWFVGICFDDVATGEMEFRKACESVGWYLTGRSNDNSIMNGIDAELREMGLLPGPTMNAQEFLKLKAHKLGMTAQEAWDGDIDLSAKDVFGPTLLEFCASMDKLGYELTFKKDRKIHVHAPHHYWHKKVGGLGWTCEMDMRSCEGMEA